MSLLKAYMLALYSHFVTKLLGDLYLEVKGPESLIELFEPKGEEEEEVEEEIILKKPDRKKNRLERFRRRNDEEESSEGEEELSSSSSRESSNSEDESDYSSDEDVIIEETREIISTSLITRLIGEHPLISSVRIGSKWLMKNQDILLEEQDINILMQRLELLFQVISLENGEYESSDEVEEAKISLKEKIGERTKFAFPEDFRLKYIKEHFLSEEMQWEEVTQDEMALLRIYDLEDFKNFLQQMKNKEADEEKKNVMMENMAQLWLQQEVKELERGRKVLRNFAHHSPYVILDHSSFCQSLKRVKDVVSLKKFIAVVPIEVIQTLDDLKKSNSGARNAIKWLERQFQDGNRWLRSQRRSEAKSLPTEVEKKMKEKEKPTLKVLECCNYFSESEEKKVTLLMANSNVEEDIRRAAESLGVAVESVIEFHPKNKNVFL